MEEVIEGKTETHEETLEEKLIKSRKLLQEELNKLRQLQQKNLEVATNIETQIQRHVGALSLIQNLEKK